MQRVRCDVGLNQIHQNTAPVSGQDSRGNRYHIGEVGYVAFGQWRAVAHENAEVLSSLEVVERLPLLPAHRHAIAFVVVPTVGVVGGVRVPLPTPRLQDNTDPGGAPHPQCDAQIRSIVNGDGVGVAAGGARSQGGCLQGLATQLPLLEHFTHAIFVGQCIRVDALVRQPALELQL